MIIQHLLMPLKDYFKINTEISGCQDAQTQTNMVTGDVVGDISL